MYHKVEKRVYKVVPKLPPSVQVEVRAEIAKIRVATNFKNLKELADIAEIKGINLPYYRQKFGDYRFMMHYQAEPELLKVIVLTHRRDTYKKQNQPWRW